MKAKWIGESDSGEHGAAENLTPDAGLHAADEHNTRAALGRHDADGAFSWLFHFLPLMLPFMHTLSAAAADPAPALILFAALIKRTRLHLATPIHPAISSLLIPIAPLWCRRWRRTMWFARASLSASFHDHPALDFQYLFGTRMRSTRCPRRTASDGTRPATIWLLHCLSGALYCSPVRFPPSIHFISFQFNFLCIILYIAALSTIKPI